MKRMTKVRRGAGICMTVLLPVLMVEILTSQEFSLFTIKHLLFLNIPQSTY